MTAALTIRGARAVWRWKRRWRARSIDLDTNEGVTGRAYLFCYLQAAAAG